MGDVPLLVRALRDPDADARGQAEQALWRIWGRSGDPEVDGLYQTGIEQMNDGGNLARRKPIDQIMGLLFLVRTRH